MASVQMSVVLRILISLVLEGVARASVVVRDQEMKRNKAVLSPE